MIIICFDFNCRFTQVTNDVVVIPLFENETKTTDSVLHDYYDPELVSRLKELSQSRSAHGPIIPILVIACNRISIRRCLDDLIRGRPDPNQFPIIVSQVWHTCFCINPFFLRLKIFQNLTPIQIGL